MRKAGKKQPVVVIVGFGFVGATLAMYLCQHGIRVIVVERDSEAVKYAMVHHRCKVKEPMMNELIKQFVKSGLLKVQANFPSSNGNTIYIICVGTSDFDHSEQRFYALRRSLISVGRHLQKGDLVAVRSTIQPELFERMIYGILEKESGLKIGKDFSLVAAPEFSEEGVAMEQLRTQAWILGCATEACGDRARELFGPILHGVPIKLMSSPAAAMATKLMRNDHRATMITTVNWWLLYCVAMNRHSLAPLDVHEIVEAANFIAPHAKIMLPGVAFGGSCLGKDLKLTRRSIEAIDLKLADLYQEVQAINEMVLATQKQRILDFPLRYRMNPADVEALCAGLAFKGHPETSDLRESMPLDIALHAGAYLPRAFGYDPIVSIRELREAGIRPVRSLRNAFRGKHIVAFLNNHVELRGISASKFAEMARPAMVFDPCGIHRKNETIIRSAGIEYVSM